MHRRSICRGDDSSSHQATKGSGNATVKNMIISDNFLITFGV